MKTGKNVIQRTLVVSMGGLAEEAGNALMQRLAHDNGPHAAVAHLALGAASSPPTAALRACLLQISQRGVRRALADLGWQLDRLHELAVFLVIDLTDGQPIQAPGRLAQDLETLTREALGIETAVLTLPLVPYMEDQAARAGLEALLAEAPRFGRGLLPLSLVNEDGIQLPAPEALAAACAALLYLLIATPLRDAPEWLNEHGGMLPGAGHTLSSAGLSIWEWSAEEAVARLLPEWTVATIQQWRGRREDLSDERETLAASAFAWVTQQQLGGGALQECVAELVTPVFVPDWHYPQPWHLPEQLRRLTTISATITQAQPDAIAQVAAELEEQVGAQARALQAHCRRLLDEAPVGGVARVEMFLSALADTLAQQQERLAIQRETQRADARAALEPIQAVAAAVEKRLSHWPGSERAAWLHLLLRPWRWPRLAWRYWQMQTHGRELVQLVRHQARQEQQQVVTAVAAQLYAQLQQWVRHVAGQADELHDMLAHVAQNQPIAGDPNAALWRLIADWEGVQAEAGRTAEALGGVGQYLTHPDDQALQAALAAAGAARLAQLSTFTAVSALMQLHPDADQLQDWWQRQWEEAAPLWRYDAAQLPEASRAQPHSLAFVCAADSHVLEAGLDLGEGRELRWLGGSDRQRIVVLRMRCGLPSGWDSAALDSTLLAKMDDMECET